MRLDWLKRRTTKTIVHRSRYRPCLELLEDRLTPAAFTVVNTFDSGAGSLRQAILDANSNLGADTIDFEIPGTGVQTISPTSALPDITDAVVINGGNNGDSANRVQISGGGALSTGLSVPESAGGPTVEIRNLVINGFTSQEILVIFGSGHVIQGNILGLDPTGTVAVPNSGDGIDIIAASNVQIGGTTAATRNVIAGFGGNGITVDSSGATIQGNFIGLDVTGTVHLGSLPQAITLFNAAATIGGTSAGAGNVIVAIRTGIEFTGNPALVHSTGTVQGNFIGTDVTGTVALNLGNGAGIDLDHATGVVINGGNVISSNGDGIDIHSSGISGASSSNTTIQGNFIGTAADGVTALGNTGDGIAIGSSSNNRVGGANIGEGNVIANNHGFGVLIADSAGTSVLGNSIFANGKLGINLSGGTEDAFGVTNNDPGDGLQDYPELDPVGSTIVSTTITGKLTSTPGATFRIEFFASNASDASGFGEGQIFLGSTDVTTGPDGIINFVKTLPVFLGPTQFVTATATDAAGNTSEFSKSAVVRTAIADLAVTQTASAASVTAGGDVTYQITVTNSGPDAGTRLILTDILQSNVDPLTVTSDALFVHQGHSLVFGLGSLNSGASTTIHITLHPTVAGFLSHSVRIDADDDSNVADNFSTNVTNVVAGAATHFSVSAPTSAVPGTPFTVSATALDQFNNTASGYRGTVQFTSSDTGPGIVLPRNFTFTSTDNGVHTFTNSVTLATGGTQTITATDTSNGAITGSAAVLAVSFTSPQFVVTNTLDSGPGSLRQAILDSNVHAGDDSIFFRIGSGPHTIFVGDSGLGALPVITDRVLIDATTQPGFASVHRPMIELSGSKLGAGDFCGLQIAAARSFVKGFVINDFAGSGIRLQSDSIEITGNYIGTDLSGKTAKGNGIAGIEILNGAGGIIGGNQGSGQGNVISGNIGGRGILIQPATVPTVIAIVGNFVGTDFTGTHPLPNNVGIEVNSQFTSIGVPVSFPGSVNRSGRNVISSNIDYGILLLSKAVVSGNFIGTDVLGTRALGNGVGIGVHAASATIGAIDGGATGGQRNVISGNLNAGLEIDGDSTLVQGNYIGTDVLGTHELGNLGSGIVVSGGSNNMIGGATTGARNVISGNHADGIRIVSQNNIVPAGNRIQGDYIGTDVTGARSLGKQQNGISISAGGQNTIGGTIAGVRNIISGNLGDGVFIGGNSANNHVQGNLIGVSASGMSKLANNIGIAIDQLSTGNSIGGTSTSARNIIAGNSSDGVFLHGDAANLVQGNFIGINLSGAAPLPNAVGVHVAATGATVGGTTLGAANVISGNSVGVLIDSGISGTVTQGNLIGVNPTGTGAIPNDFGVKINSGFNNTIGGTVARAGNVISGNKSAGIVVTGGDGNLIQGNVIGADAGGRVKIGNGQGILFDSTSDNTIGGAAASARNIISGNKGDGVSLIGAGAGNQVLGNFIGTDVTGTAALANINGLIVSSSNTTIGGTTPEAANVISGNAADGVLISQASGVQVLGNFIGTDVSGTKALQNGAVVAGKAQGNGVRIDHGNNNTIGGTIAGSRNVISGNANDGVLLQGESANAVLGNLIGVNVLGTSAIANGTVLTGGTRVGNGIEVSDSEFNLIGGSDAASRNLISGNIGAGVRLTGTRAKNNLVRGNFVGSDISGSAALANGVAGVLIDGKAQNNQIGDAAAESGNLISGNAVGVIIRDAATSENAVVGNRIGTDVAGNLPLPNRTGVSIENATDNSIGGIDVGAGNIISGNVQFGILIFGNSATPGSANLIQGNLIGTDDSGTAAIPNGQGGIFLTDSANSNLIGGTNPGARNVISGNAGPGIEGQVGGNGIPTGNQVQGNFIGTDYSGMFALPNKGGVILDHVSSTLIGGTDPGAANVISGNTLDGIQISSSTTANNQVQGNLIGADVTGFFAVPNTGNGIRIAGSRGNIIGGTTSDATNVISGNIKDGVLITSLGTGNQVLGNFIGADASGSFALRNAGNGVHVTGSASGNTIAGNVIAFNGLGGAMVDSGVKNRISGNSIFANSGLGIGLVSANNANNQQIAPLITSAALDLTGTTITIAGSLSSTTDMTFTLEFFASPAGSPQGKVYLGATTVTIAANRSKSFTAQFFVELPVGAVITATATDSNGNTSKFSSERPVS